MGLLLLLAGAVGLYFLCHRQPKKVGDVEGGLPLDKQQQPKPGSEPEVRSEPEIDDVHKRMAVRSPKPPTSFLRSPKPPKPLM